MKEIYVNLKRFDVPKKLGGICLMEDPGEWIEWVIEESIKSGLGKLDDITVTIFLPEGLLIKALEKLATYPADETRTLSFGCQGVYRENIAVGGNFGAFTTNKPAAAIKNYGCNWVLVAHSEERKDKLGILEKFEPGILIDANLRKKAKDTVDAIMNQEVLCAINSGMNVLLCIGETAEEKGEGTFEEQKPRIEEVLKSQLEIGLKDAVEAANKNNLKIGIAYEPIWAIGPGKVPPGEEYISFVSAYVKKVVKELYGIDISVVYGGGLKEENAGMIAGIKTIDGGLVALTKFTGDIAFEPDGLKKIIEKYKIS